MINYIAVFWWEKISHLERLVRRIPLEARTLIVKNSGLTYIFGDRSMIREALLKFEKHKEKFKIGFGVSSVLGLLFSFFKSPEFVQGFDYMLTLGQNYDFFGINPATADNTLLGKIIGDFGKLILLDNFVVKPVRLAEFKLTNNLSENKYKVRFLDDKLYLQPGLIGTLKESADMVLFYLRNEADLVFGGIEKEVSKIETYASIHGKNVLKSIGDNYVWPL